MLLADVCQILFLLLLLLISCLRGCSMQDGYLPSPTIMKVGVILDLSIMEGKVADTCIHMAAEDFASNGGRSHSKKLVLHVRDYQKGDVTGAASAAIDLLENAGVQAIVGPLASSEVEFIAALGGKAQVPIISFTETSPSPSMAVAPYFIRTAESGSCQVAAIAGIVKAYGWREAVLIYEDSQFGKGMIPSLMEALEGADVKVASRSLLSTDCSRLFIKEQLYRLMTMQTRVFIVHMAPSLGTRLFSSALELGMMSKGYAWIVTTGMGNLLDSLHPSEFDSLQGVLGLKTHIPETKELEDFTARWKRRFRVEHPELEIPRYVSVSGLWAYDTVWALASALEETAAAPRNPLDFRRFGRSSKSSTNIMDLAVSPTGPQLLEEISKTKFRGLSGEFEVKGGQLTSGAFQIVNVIGRGERGVGFWNPTMRRLSKTPNEQDSGSEDESYSIVSENLKVVVWPGETAEVPRGWVLPTSGKKLRVGVPVKKRFKEFVDVETNLANGHSAVSGFCIDIFEAALELLPYALPHEYVPYVHAHGESSGSYNNLLHQVFHGEFDAAVADVTILAERSQYVDFTFPYTDGGLSLLVPVKDEDRQSVFVFLKPFSRGLWLMTAAFFLLIAAVVWVLEHRRNHEFRGSPADHIGLAFYFAFSTLVFAHRERLTSNSARFVVIVWSFAVLILTSSYTASLSSTLTVGKFQPTIKDVDTLIRKGEYVGYQNGSFVLDILKRLNFDESKLRPYTTVEDYVHALASGSRNGGVAAIVDETPYLQLFLATYCQGFAMVGPIYRTGGYGFAFPKGSSLLPDVSRAVLNVTEGEKMSEIEKAWFGNQTCLDSKAGVASKGLTLSSFWGLFVITGAVSSGAFSAFLFSIFADHRRRIRRVNAAGEEENWKKTMNVAENRVDIADRDVSSMIDAKDHRIDDSEGNLIIPAETI
ncbi:unnamed protein product [Victoria cruziana]